MTTERKRVPGRDRSRVTVEKTRTSAKFAYCELPPYYFENALRMRAETGEFPKRKLLSVTTWDGRPVLSVESATA